VQRGFQAPTCGAPVLRRSDIMVTFGHRDHSVLWCCSYHSSFNLMAGVPYWMPFHYSVEALNAKPSPSGLVPGGGANSRGVECIFLLGGEGPDFFPRSFLWDLVCNF
jgi:hypothetical protein